MNRPPSAKSSPRDRHDAAVVDRAVAFLLVASEAGKQIVAECCEQADAAGVRAGMTLAHAQAYLRDCSAEVYPFVPDEDAAGLVRLARWALRFSPMVAADPPDGLLLDITGCERLFGGEERLLELVAGSLDRLGLPASFAVAPSYAGAWGLARFDPREPRTSVRADSEPRIIRVDAASIGDAFATLPVAALRIDETTQAALQEVGLERVEQLLQLPRNELPARFGRGLLKRLDQAFGRAPETIDPVRLIEPVEAQCVFDGPIKRAEVIERAVEHLLNDLLTELNQRQHGVHRLEARFFRSSLEPAGFSVVLTRPSRDRDHLWTLMRPRLERVHLGYGVEEITLRAAGIGRIGHAQRMLEGDEAFEDAGADASALGELFDRMIDRLGPDRVHCLEAVERYAPEQAFRAAGFPPSLSGKGYRAKDTSEVSVQPANRPSHLLHPPQPIRVLAIVPDGPPSWFRWGDFESDVAGTRGPERIVLPWWDGEGPEVRDYYEVCDRLGRWLWIFRRRRSNDEDAARDWFVHGEWS